VALAAITLAEISGCGTDAVGVERCRRVELARCDAAEACGTVSDATACRRFYYDQCLHGLPVSDPGVSAANACGAMLERATACVAEQGAEAALADCASAVTEESTLATSVCELVSTPELAAECRFLDPGAPVPEPGSEGTGGAASEGGGGAPADDAGGNAGNAGESPSETGAGGSGENEPAAGAGGIPLE
jgi:hypothetical protein